MRYLAIDPGDRRTGLAVGDDITRQAGPVGVIEAGEPAQLLRGIQRAIEEHGPDALVIGIPFNMDGTAGPAAKKAQALALLLQGSTGLRVYQVDERLTTFEADDLMKGHYTRKQKKERRDAIAAAAILRDFLQNPQRGETS